MRYGFETMKSNSWAILKPWNRVLCDRGLADFAADLQALAGDEGELQSELALFICGDRIQNFTIW